jgi:arylsulfatase A-like enzyme
MAATRSRRTNRSTVWWACALLAACGVGDDPRPDPPAALELIVWVEVDTLRASALGAYADGSLEPFQPRTPSLDALAAEGQLFEWCYSAAPWTVPSLVTQLTGRYPFDHGATRLLEAVPSELVTLPEVLQSAGWRTAGVGTNFVATGRLGFAQGFEAWDDSLALGHEGSTAEVAVERLLAQLDAFGAPSAEQPIFLFTLLFEPHFRYLAQPGARVLSGYEGPLTGREELSELRAMVAAGELDERDLEFLRSLYAGEVETIDRAFGQLRAALEERGLWERALVVFTSDHGEELGEDGWIGHTTRLSDSLVHVPLILRAPDSFGLVGGARIDVPVSQVDLARTLLDLAGVPEDSRGPHLESAGSFAPLLFGAREPERRYLYLHTHFEPVLEHSAPKRAHQWGVVDAVGRAKWVVDHDVGPRERPSGRMAPLGDDGAAVDGPLAPEWSHLARLRGLLTEPLGDRRGDESVPVVEPVGGGD